MKITFARAALALLAGCAPLQPGDPGYTYWNDPTFRSGEARDRIDQEYIARFQAKCKRVGEVARASGDWRTPLHEFTNEEYNAVHNRLYWPSVLTSQESMCVDILVGAGILVRPARQLSPGEVIMLCEPIDGYSPCSYPR